MFVHALVGEAAEEDFVGGVVGVDGDAYAASNDEGVAGDCERLAQGLADAVQAAVGDEVGRQVGWEISGDDDELVTTEAGEGVGDADRVAEIAGYVLEEFVADLVAE